ncbi:MAG: hypothetical protein R2698_06520 [Microthrixaceae bacterium]
MIETRPVEPRRPLRHPRRRAPSTVAMATVVTLLVTGCQLTRAGARCSGSGFGRDSKGWVLQCRRGRMVRIMTIADYVRFVDFVQQRDAAERARRESSAVRAQSFRGTSAWVDVYDWSPTFVASRNPTATPGFTLAQVDRMAQGGINSLYIQTAKAELGDSVLDRDRLTAIVARARSYGIRVIGWYLPTFADPAVDRDRLAAAAGLGLDGVAVDIESTAVDLATRNQRLIELSHWMRTSFPSTPLAAIVLPPVVTEVINLNYWPQFPWRDLARDYDVWMPMAYWTNRTAMSGWRDGYRYTKDNIDRIRSNLGDPGAAVHPIGGLSDTATGADVDGFVRAAIETGAIGAGLYDDAISTLGQYQQLVPMARR